MIAKRLCTAATMLACAGSVGAADLSVTITNLTQGIYFTPFLAAAHVPSADPFEPGEAASESIKRIAECGDFAGLASDLETVGADLVENPAGGPLGPGASVSFDLTTSAGNTRLTTIAMLLPTNDGFAALDSQAIPTASGTHTYYLNALDAGSEANNELLDTSGCTVGMPGIPAAPGGNAGSNGTGVTTEEANNHIHVHRGNLGDTNPNAGASDLDSRVHRWQNPVLKIDVTVE